MCLLLLASSDALTIGVLTARPVHRVQSGLQQRLVLELVEASLWPYLEADWRYEADQGMPAPQRERWKKRSI